ncbi:hypothetical protein C1H46_011959 [Malus baccata]|uniref:Uncharacterized protein n=1 Tax=Malus baccata TaxID=106549 RepID=A0A540MUG2_MALBA|nr:hypothetical protein C1H46_011959 [Malus baccata]
MEIESEMKQQSKFRRICVFCESSQGKKSNYQDVAIEPGKELNRCTSGHAYRSNGVYSSCVIDFFGDTFCTKRSLDSSTNPGVLRRLSSLVRLPLPMERGPKQGNWGRGFWLEHWIDGEVGVNFSETYYILLGPSFGPVISDPIVKVCCVGHFVM